MAPGGPFLLIKVRIRAALKPSSDEMDSGQREQQSGRERAEWGEARAAGMGAGGAQHALGPA